MLSDSCSLLHVRYSLERRLVVQGELLQDIDNRLGAGGWIAITCLPFVGS